MFNRTFRSTAAIATIGLALGLAPSAPSIAQTSYTIVDLGVCSPRAINRNGQVTGYKRFSPQDKGDHAFLWNPSTNTFVKLALPKGYSNGYGKGINNFGDVVGTISSSTPYIGEHAFLWPSGGAGQFVGPTSKTVLTVAHAVNDSKAVVGFKFGTGGGAYLSKIVNGNRQLYIIGTGAPNAINSSGQILVDTSDFDFPRGYLWTPSGAPGQGTAASLPTGYVAYSLTDSGAMTGVRIYEAVEPWGTFNSSMPVVYSPVTGTWMDIPWPPAIPQGQWDWATATSINSSGVVVGLVEAADAEGYQVADTGFIWDSVNGTRDLNALIPAGTGWVLCDLNASAPFINDSGWIIGTGLLNGARRAFLLIPN